MESHATFIVNPAACSGRGAKRWRDLEPLVRAAYPQAEVQMTAARGHARELATAAAERAATESAARAGPKPAVAAPALIVAVGGDGTTHEVASGLLALEPTVREGVRLGVLQNGTGNDFVRGAGIPQRPEDALALMVAGTERRFDAGRIRCAALPGRAGEDSEVTRWFLNAADFGIGAAVVRAVEGGPRWLDAKPSYLWQTLRKLLTWHNPPVELRLDDGPTESFRIKTVAICNQPFLGGGMCVAPEAVPDDGILSCTIFGDLGRLEAMRRLGETYRGARVEHADIHYRTCRRLEATSSSRVLIETDGELAGALPARFEVVRAALRVAAP